MSLADEAPSSATEDMEIIYRIQQSLLRAWSDAVRVGDKDAVRTTEAEIQVLDRCLDLVRRTK